MKKFITVLVFTAITFPVHAASLEIVTVANGIHAIVGELGQRSPTNFANNATFGAIETASGVVLIDPGGSVRGAAVIESAINQVTDKFVTHVINTGGQDHRWLGNGYFKAKGAKIIASLDAVNDQKERVHIQLEGLEFLIGRENLAGTEPVYADDPFEGMLKLTIGGVDVEFHHTGGAHTPGDSFVWLPASKIMFTGDIVYLERLLGVIEVTNTKAWVKTFNAMATFNPKVIVPGHGRPADLAKAKAETLDYLVNLRTKIRAVHTRGENIKTGTAIDQRAFSKLQNFNGLARRNAQAVFIEMEFD